MVLKYTFIKVTLGAMFLLLGGCGGGGGSDSPTTKFGNFKYNNQPITGIQYETQTQSDVTGANGEFQYLADETVTFSIGGIQFDAVDAEETITLQNIVGTNDISDTAVVNISRLLETLDDDGQPDNGISIADNALDSDFATQLDFNASADAFETAVQPLMDDLGTELVSVEEIIPDVEERTLVGSWQFGGDGPTIFHIMPEGRYLALQLEDENGQEGFEYGTYSVDDGEIVFHTRVNHDGFVLTCHADRHTLCDGENGESVVKYEYSFSDEGQLILKDKAVPDDTGFMLDKAALTDSPVDGLWEIRGVDDTQQLIYFANGGSGGAGNFYNVTYDPDDSNSETVIQVATYELRDNDTAFQLDFKTEYRYFGIDCSVDRGDDCGAPATVPFHIINGQMVIIVPDDNTRRYLDPILVNGMSATNNATLIAQKDYAADIAANADHGLALENDFRTYIQPTQVGTSASSFKASFNIDETSYLEATENGSLQLRLETSYRDPSNESAGFDLELRLRNFGGGPSARYELSGCAGENCAGEVDLEFDPVQLSGNFTGDHVMEITYDQSANTFVYIIDDVEVGRISMADFTQHANITSEGGYSFDPSHFTQVRFRLDVYDIDSEEESGLLKVHMDEFSIDGAVYDDFPNGFLDNRKWLYRSEDR